jgi:hypothetical protein
MAHGEQEAKIIFIAKCSKPVQEGNFLWKAVEGDRSSNSNYERRPFLGDHLRVVRFWTRLSLPKNRAAVKFSQVDTAQELSGR